MDILALVRSAQAAGLRVRVEDGQIAITGNNTPANAAIVAQLAAHKPAIMRLQRMEQLLGRQYLVFEEPAELRALAQEFGIVLHWRRFDLNQGQWTDKDQVAPVN